MSEFVIKTKDDDWRQRLDTFIALSANKPFRWGEHDCGLFAAAGVKAQIGEDFAADVRGRYDSLESGLTLLRSLGFDDHVALAAAKLPEIPWVFAQIGDIAVVDFGAAGQTLTIVGGHRLHGPMPGMSGTLPFTRACRAFAVGRMPDL
jgi:hypothetical protein